MKKIYLFLSFYIISFVSCAVVPSGFILPNDTSAVSAIDFPDYIQRADAGDTDAQRVAGLCFLYGEGVDADHMQAWKLIARSASSGDHLSQFYVGMMYLDGLGVARNSKEAAYWLRKAASNGQPDAQYYTGKLFYNGDGVLQDFRIAAEWYWRAAAQGNPQAQYALAEMYRDGIGVEKNPRKAREWFDKAAARNFGDAAAQASKLPPANGTVGQTSRKKSSTASQRRKRR